MGAGTTNTTTIGRFHVVRELGRGDGPCVVYEVSDPETGERLALKLLPRAAHTRYATLQFKRELLAQRRVDHVNVVKVKPGGAGHDGSGVFFTMELVDGPDLRHFIDAQPPPTDVPPPTTHEPSVLRALNDERRHARIVDAFTQLAHALGAVHAEHVVHCGVEFANALVRADGVVKLIDFGRALSRDDVRDATMDPDPIVGAIQYKYIAPEQALGADGDRRADLYSLGVMLYEVLAGRHPFYSENSVGYAYHHARKPAPTVARFNPGADPALAALAEGLMKKDPRERLQSAADVVAALGGGEPEEPTQPTAAPPTRARARDEIDAVLDDDVAPVPPAKR